MTMMRKCASGSDLEISMYTHAELRNVRVKARYKDKSHVDESKRLTRQLYIKKLYAIALMEYSRHIAYHQDAGGQEFDMVYTGIRSDFSKAVSDNETHCLAIVPKEMIESWLLADEKAYPSIPTAPRLPSKPEELWGDKRDVNSNYPYNYFVRVLSQFGLDDNSDTYKEIAEKTDIEVLKNRCEKSFGQFYTDMQSFIGNTPCPR
jgi:hypothetical protein